MDGTTFALIATAGGFGLSLFGTLAMLLKNSKNQGRIEATWDVTLDNLSHEVAAIKVDFAKITDANRVRIEGHIETTKTLPIQIARLEARADAVGDAIGELKARVVERRET